MEYPCGWVSPFGHCRIKACCQLPDTFRRLPRPSSPLTAKASTVCAYSLDHITRSRLRADQSFRLCFTNDTSRQTLSQRLLRPRFSMNCNKTSTSCRSILKSVRSSSMPPCAGGASRDRTGDPLLAKQVLSQLSYGPDVWVVCASLNSPYMDVRALAKGCAYWWVWEDSNHRPHPYQGCALTT